MSIVREMRERQAMTAAPERSGLAGTLAIGCAAFAIGAIAIVGWKLWPAPKASPPAAAATSQPAPKFSGKRLGHAEHAPLLGPCIKSDTFEGFGGGNPQAVYSMLTMVGTASRVGALLGAETGGGSAQLTEYWGEIANCVYRQNSWNLCEPDNRALAVESASAFIRGAAQVAGLSDGRSRNAQFILANNAKIKQQVLDTLRTRVRNGYIVADDFGPMVPPEIKALLAETKTIANGCVKQ